MVLDNKSDISQIQIIELDMLLEVDSICRRLGINYFMVGGTLLGAVRHKGFIPWDDDVDIGMLRQDYEKFVSEAQNYLPSYLFLQTMDSEEQLPYNFAKVRNSCTTFIESTTKDLTINHGIYIDIFPFDYYPENSLISFINKQKIKIINHKIMTAFSFDYELDYSIAGKIANAIAKILFKDVHSALIARDKIYKSVKKSSLVTNYCGAWGSKEIVPVQWLTELTELEFEGYMFRAPSAYDKYLRHVYGDYMELPPVEKRTTHHYSEIIDTQNSYIQYTSP